MSERTPSAAAVLEATLRWGGSLIAVQRLDGDGELTLGDEEGCSFLVSHPDLGAGRVPLLRRAGRRVEVHVHPGMRARVGGAEVPAASVLTLDEEQEIELEVGALVFELRWAPRQPSMRTALWGAVDVLYSKVLALALIAQLGLVVAVHLSPDLSWLDDETWPREAPSLFVPITPKDKAPPPPPPRTRETRPEVDPAPEFGRSAKARPRARARRESATALATEAIQALGVTGMGGSSGPGLGALVEQGLDQLRASSAAEHPGAGSRDLEHDGTSSVLGIGDLHQPRERAGGSGGDIWARFRKKARVVPRHPSDFIGSLKRGEIQRVLDRHLSQIRACYERALLGQPDLKGKLVLAWTIGRSGLVTRASVASDTMNAREVRTCVTRVVRRMRFPPPRGEGVVEVTYPFVFDLAG